MSYRTSPLSRGLSAIVDAADFDALNQHKWYAGKNRTGKFYAIRHARDPITGKEKKVKMHREIMGLCEGDPRQVDHIYPPATLDNRRMNLRIATKTQNSHNRGANRNNTSGFKGVSFHRRIGKWGANIHADGNRRSLGYFLTAEAAAEAYKSAARKLHGAFSRTEIEATA